MSYPLILILSRQGKKGKSVFPPREKTEGVSVRGGDEDEQITSHYSQLTPYFISKQLLLVTK
ncbi:MAG TPA: hypothetical protein DCY12_08615 [Candidatus Atribacteria bacterium]|nr:hypothetical protein [Candidatus Atribacteria bacterium]